METGKEASIKSFVLTADCALSSASFRIWSATGLADGAASQSSAVEQLLATVTEVTGQVEENSRGQCLPV